MNYEALAQCPLFAGIAADRLERAVTALSPRQAEYERDQTILLQGEAPRGLGILLSGAALIVKEDYWGVRTVVAALAPGDLFAEAFCCAGVAEMPVGVVAAEKSRALFGDPARLLAGGAPDREGRQILDNLMHILARKNLLLLQRLAVISRRTLRDKILTYLSYCAQEAEARSFRIPLDRQGLADYLAADRSALSAELSRMQKEGLIVFRKNSFELKKRFETAEE